MIRRPPRSTRTDTLFPYTTLFRSNPDLPVILAGDFNASSAERRTYLTAHSAANWTTKRRLPIDNALQHCLKSDAPCGSTLPRSEEHTSELQSLMRISYAVFCLKKKNSYYTKPNNSLQKYI